MAVPEDPAKASAALPIGIDGGVNQQVAAEVGAYGISYTVIGRGFIGP